MVPYGLLPNKTSMCILPQPKEARYSNPGVSNINPNGAGRIIAGYITSNSTMIFEFKCDNDFRETATVTAVAQDENGNNHYGSAEFECHTNKGDS